MVPPEQLSLKSSNDKNMRSQTYKGRGISYIIGDHLNLPWSLDLRPFRYLTRKALQFIMLTLKDWAPPLRLGGDRS